MKLEQFLVKAKLNAYASGGEAAESTAPDSAKEFLFEDSGYRYRDRYFGWNPFVGEEVVWQKNKVIWAMNYYGAVNDIVVPPERIYPFLQKAMKLVAESRPFRGPHYLKEEQYEYRDDSQGTIDQFTGIERIFFKGEEVYRLIYHGGLVKNK